MGQIKWYKRDPQDALDGMAQLTLEERGAYNTVLDLFYVRDGKLPDDERFIAGYLNCDVRVWRRIRGRLIDLGKLFIEDGHIHNRRADEVVRTTVRMLVGKRDAGKASAHSRARKSDAKSNKNNDEVATGVAACVPTPVATSVLSNEIKNKNNTPLPPKGEISIEPDLPDWLPAEAWSGFEDMRKRIKKPLTPRARSLAIAKLDELRQAGNDPGAVLDRSVLNSWQGLFELPRSNGGGGHASPPGEPMDFLDFKIQQRRQREEWERQRREQVQP